MRWSSAISNSGRGDHVLSMIRQESTLCGQSFTQFPKPCWVWGNNWPSFARSAVAELDNPGRDLPRLPQAQAITLQNLGAIADFVSSVLVLITLIYIAVQTNHARRSPLSVEQHAVHSGHRELLLALMNSPELPDSMAKASAGSELNAAETIA